MRYVDVRPGTRHGPLSVYSIRPKPDGTVADRPVLTRGYGEAAQQSGQGEHQSQHRCYEQCDRNHENESYRIHQLTRLVTANASKSQATAHHPNGVNP